MQTGVATARMNQMFADRGSRVRELKSEGRTIIGYLCSLTPVEMIHAAGLIPYRMTGSMRDPITEAGRCMEDNACSFTRSVFDQALKGTYSFLDGYVIPHACDNIVKCYEIWPEYVPHRFAHFVNVPHTLSHPSLKFFEAELATFRKSLESFTGHSITDEVLQDSVRLHNRQRTLVRNLYDLRKCDPPLISGTEMLKTTLTAMSLPVEEANDLLGELVGEVERRISPKRSRRSPRIMVYGTGNDDIAFLEIVEETGGDVVIDDLCFGTRTFGFEVDVTADPLEGIARSYLQEIKCPRTFRESPGTHQADLENRFGHILRFAREFSADGVILYTMMYCDTHAFSAPDLKEYLASTNLPVLHVEEEYPLTGKERLRTRVQAFLETLAY